MTSSDLSKIFLAGSLFMSLTSSRVSLDLSDGGKMWLLAGTHGHVVIIVARRARSADRDAERPCMAADMNHAKTTTVAP